MLAAGLKSPYAVLHQTHQQRGPNARVNKMKLKVIAKYLGLNKNSIEVGKPFNYTNSKWGLAGVDLPEVCFIKGIHQTRSCLPDQKP